MPTHPIHARGDFMVAAGGVVEDPRRARIKKGLMLTSTPRPGQPAKRYRLPTQYEEFEQTANLAAQLGAEEKLAMLKANQDFFMRDMAQRFARVREQLDTIVKPKITKARKHERP